MVVIGQTRNYAEILAAILNGWKSLPIIVKIIAAWFLDPPLVWNEYNFRFTAEIHDTSANDLEELSLLGISKWGQVSLFLC